MGDPTNAFDVLRDTLRTYMNEASDHISTGGCKNFEEYQFMTGQIKGLALAERELLDLQRRIEDA